MTVCLTFQQCHKHVTAAPLMVQAPVVQCRALSAQQTSREHRDHASHLLEACTFQAPRAKPFACKFVITCPCHAHQGDTEYIVFNFPCGELMYLVAPSVFSIPCYLPPHTCTWRTLGSAADCSTFTTVRVGCCEAIDESSPPAVCRMLDGCVTCHNSGQSANFFLSAARNYML